MAIQCQRNHPVFTHRCAPCSRAPVSEALFFRWNGFCAELSGPVSPISDCCLTLSWGSNRKAIFLWNRYSDTQKAAFDDFPDFSWPPLKRANLVTDFTFYSFLRLFSGPISPICWFLRCFYRPQKPDPQKVTKSYVRVTKSYGRVTKSYKKLQKVTNKLRNSYKKLWKLQTSYQMTRT